MRQLENDGHMLVHACLPGQRRAEQIMAMPAAKRRWTAREGRALIAESPLATPRYELVDGVVKRPRYQEHIPEYWIFDLDARLVERWRSREERPEIVVQALEWHLSGATEPFRLALPEYFAEVFDEG